MAVSGHLFVDDFQLHGPTEATFLNAVETLVGVGALHGGAIAAFALLAVRRLSGQTSCPLTSAASFHIDYMRAGRGQIFNTHVNSLRKVKELGFFDLTVRNAQDEAVAGVQAALTANKAVARSAAPWTTPAGDASEFEAASRAVPFLRDRGLEVRGADAGVLEMSFQPVERNLDTDGSLHEGAMLTLIDSAGSNIPYTLRRPTSHGATLSLSAYFTGHRPTSTVQARARIRHRTEQYYWSDIDLVDAEQKLCSFATVLYRFSEAG